MLQWTWGCGYFFELVFLFFSDTYSEAGLMDYMIVLFSTFWHTSILFSIVAAPIYIPTNIAQGFPFFHILPTPVGLPRWLSDKESACQCQKTQEMQVLSLGQEDPLEEKMATYSSIAWEIPWTEEHGRLQSVVSQRVGHDWATNTHIHVYFLKVDFIFAIEAELMGVVLWWLTWSF